MPQVFWTTLGKGVNEYNTLYYRIDRAIELHFIVKFLGCDPRLQAYDYLRLFIIPYGHTSSIRPYSPYPYCVWIESLGILNTKLHGRLTREGEQDGSTFN